MHGKEMKKKTNCSLYRVDLPDEVQQGCSKN
jgi:hypothetical protein